MKKIIIQIGRQEIREGFSIEKISMHTSLGKIPKAVITLKEDTTQPTPSIFANATESFPGTEITVTLVESVGTKAVFNGLITKLEVKNNREAVITKLTCFDSLMKMDIRKQNCLHQCSRNAELYAELAAKYGVQINADASNTLFENMIQFEMTDWTFLNQQANASGMVVRAFNGSVEIFSPNSEKFGTNRIESNKLPIAFEAAMDSRSQIISGKGKVWDFASQEIVSTGIITDEGAEPGEISAETHSRVFDNGEIQLKSQSSSIAEMEEKVRNLLEFCKLSKITGKMIIDEFMDFSAGEFLDVQHDGSSFNGKHFINGISWQFKNDRWETVVLFGLDHSIKKNLLNQSEKQYKQTLMYGKVLQNCNDPAGEERILVKIPLIDEANGIWCRLAMVSTGEHQGIIQRPEIDQEVLLGFLDSGLHHAVILGNMYGSANSSMHEPGVVRISAGSLISLKAAGLVEIKGSMLKIN